MIPTRPIPAREAEREAWASLAERLGWARERPVLSPILRGGAHDARCDCVNCLGRLPVTP